MINQIGTTQTCGLGNLLFFNSNLCSVWSTTKLQRELFFVNDFLSFKILDIKELIKNALLFDHIVVARIKLNLIRTQA